MKGLASAELLRYDGWNSDSDENRGSKCTTQMWCPGTWVFYMRNRWDWMDDLFCLNVWTFMSTNGGQMVTEYNPERAASYCSLTSANY